MIGLGTIGAYGLAASFYKGDVEAAYAPIFGGEGKPDARPAPLADVATPLAWIAATHPELRPTYIILHDPGTRGQHVQLLAEPPQRLIYGESYNFDANGRFLGAVGLADGQIGPQMASPPATPNSANFGGLPEP